MVKVAICLLLFVTCSPNRVDKKHRKQGRWKTYYDDKQTRKMWTGRYKNHEQTGKWKYYSRSGVLYMKEKYQKDSFIKTTYYYPNGKKHLQGYATYIETEDTTYYRWEGNWVNMTQQAN
jgi:antitoxin component YwqK of YwqJK toxin-antitoxin module